MAELLEQRATIQQWLDKLEEQRGSVSEKILSRVRDDYRQRLEQTLEALTGHSESVRSELDGARERLARASAAHTHAAEELEEGRLRNLIGELDEISWGTERARLEIELKGAAEEEQSARKEADRLQEVLDRMQEHGRSTLPGRPTPIPEPRIAREDAPSRNGALKGGAHEEQISEEETFLEEIDRALATSEEAPPSAEQPEREEGEDAFDENTAPKPGLKCQECGYTNDLSAWFCGVCGADVG